MSGAGGIWGFAENDRIVTKPYPGMIFIPLETGGLYFELREIAGDLWLAQNAQFNTVAQNWYQPNPPCDFTQAANATVFRQAGQIQRYSVAGTLAAATILNWGAPFWQVDPTGASTSLGATRVGIVQNVPADGSTPGQVVFQPTPFALSCTGATFGVINAPANPWQLSAPQIDPATLTNTGFNFYIRGGPQGSQVAVFYIAVGQ